MSEKTTESEQEKLLAEIRAILKQGGKTYDMIPEIEKAMIESSGSSFSERKSEAHGEVSPIEGIVRLREFLKERREAAQEEMRVQQPFSDSYNFAWGKIKMIDQVEEILKESAT